MQVLSDPRSRKNYDYALAHPEDTLYNEYQYYYSRYEKYWKTDPKVVVLGFLAIISVVQYASRNAAYTQVSAAAVLRSTLCGSAGSWHVAQVLHCSWAIADPAMVRVLPSWGGRHSDRVTAALVRGPPER